jgi:YVTN family beta-propeller protein
VYLANMESNNVMVIDPSSDSVIATVAVGGSPYELCHNAPKNKIYAANYGQSVSIINGASNSLIYTVTEVGARFICCNSTGTKVYTAQEGQGYVIDGRFDMKWDSFPAGSSVHDIMYAPGPNKVYMTEYSGNAVWVIDAAADTLIRTVVVGNTTEGLCYNPHDNKVYCSVVSQRRVMVLDGNGDTLVAVVNVGTNPRALCYDSVHNKIYCTNDGDSVVHIISGSADSVVAACTTGVGPVALAWAPDLNKVFVANYQGSSVAVIRDTTPASVEEPPHASPSHAAQLPTVLLGPTPVALDGATLHDMAGRKVAVMERGVDYASRLAPGVYFVRAGHQTARKVILAR